MKEKLALYKKQITELNVKYNNLKIHEDDNLARQFHIVSAGLINYLPQIDYSRHEAIFKNILLHQRLSILDQDAIHVLDSAIIKNFTAQSMQLLKVKPAIICTFHLGSYRLINLLLAKHNIPFSLVIAQKIVSSQGAIFKTLHSQFRGNDNFNLIDAESSSSALQMFRELKKKKNLIIYIDGNTGAGTQTGQNENSCCISFFNQQIMARKGIGFLCHAANVPVLPVICYRDSLEEITLQFFDLIYPNMVEERSLFAQMLTQKLYNLASSYIAKYPHQWEAWLYLHKVARIIKPLATDTNLSNVFSVNKLMFNSVKFGLFKVNQNNYIFNKANYISYPIAGNIYLILSEARFKPLNKNYIDVNLLTELYKHQVLIAA